MSETVNHLLQYIKKALLSEIKERKQLKSSLKSQLKALKTFS